VYKRILVPLEHSDYDAAILEHVSALAHFCGASIVLIHVADGWAARNLKQLNLRESEEMRLDREYIEAQCAALTASGLRADSVLAAGDPSKEIAAAAARESCDLIAMSTHGHRFIKDIIYGSVAERSTAPVARSVLLVRGERRTPRDNPIAPPPNPPLPV
jgi:nucleotide-binding universal stress UspA family protein